MARGGQTHPSSCGHPISPSTPAVIKTDKGCLSLQSPGGMSQPVAPIPVNSGHRDRTP